METLFDVIIVGSGPAGTWAAKQLKTKNVLVLDVGRNPSFSYKDNSQDYYDLKKSEKGFPILIGNKYESLSNIFEDYLSPKLKAPYMKYINQGTPYSKIDESGFNSQQSFAMGGLANAWGAGCFRFQDNELRSFPFQSKDLDPYYDILTKEIGISGCADDLTPFYGTTKDLLEPIKKTRQLQKIYEKYLAKKTFFQDRGIFFGHPRLAYKNYRAQGLDFYLSHNPSIYTPAFTMQEMIEAKKINYQPNIHVTSFKEDTDSVYVFGSDLQTGEKLKFKGKNLILAMGALNTSKCVLQSRNDFSTELPLLDNNISYVPFLYPRMLGLNWNVENVIGSPMTMVIQRPNDLPIQASVYNVGSVLITDLLPSLPISADFLPSAGKLALPALIVAQVFYPDAHSKMNFLKLKKDGHIQLQYTRGEHGVVEGNLIKTFRRIGLFSAGQLVQYPTPGNSFHYAGMFPMKSNPQSVYECDTNGKLEGTQRVYIADAANFPELPAKNHTFTIMANAMRIADVVQRRRLDS